MMKKKMKPISAVYLGGMYQAEYSIWHSFMENKSRLVFPVENNHHGMTMKSNYYFNNHSQQGNIIIDVDKSALKQFIQNFKPDVVIHRYYLDNPCMHENAWDVCQSIGVPYLRLLMETDPTDHTSCNGNNFDALLYAHDTEYFRQNAGNSGKPAFFYHYGVSGFERSMGVEKTKNFGGLGYYRYGINQRYQSLCWFLDALRPLEEPLHVYGGVNDWFTFDRVMGCVVNPLYSLEQTPAIINQHRVILNFESLPYTDGAYSHKLFQAVGCGVPVITRHKDGLASLFENNPNNLILAKNDDELNFWVNDLYDNEWKRKRMAHAAYEFSHRRFDWFKRLYEILEKLKII